MLQPQMQCQSCCPGPCVCILKECAVQSAAGPWTDYADEQEAGPLMAAGRMRDGRLARRAKRREAFRERQQPMLDERRARKDMVRRLSDTTPQV